MQQLAIPILIIFSIGFFISSPLIYAEYEQPAIYAKKKSIAYIHDESNTTIPAKKAIAGKEIKECIINLPTYEKTKYGKPQLIGKSVKTVKVYAINCGVDHINGEPTAMSLGQHMKSIGKHNPKILLNKRP